MTVDSIGISPAEPILRTFGTKPVEYSNGKVQNVLRISMAKLLDRELSADGSTYRNGALHKE